MSLTLDDQLDPTGDIRGIAEEAGAYDASTPAARCSSAPASAARA